jgi:hypothetical protein
LDLIQLALEREHFDLCRFDGTMDVKKKAAAITEFKSQTRKPKVLIVSLKAGGVGLNVGDLCDFLPSMPLMISLAANNCKSCIHGMFECFTCPCPSNMSISNRIPKMDCWWNAAVENQGCHSFTLSIPASLTFDPSH